MVKEVASKEEFDQILSNENNLVVVDFTASWCGPCRAIAPHLDRLSQAYPDVVFLKVDVDKCRSIASAHNIRAMPTFKLFKKGGELYHVFKGASPQNLEDAVKHYSAADAVPNPDAAKADEGGSCVVL